MVSLRRAIPARTASWDSHSSYTGITPFSALSGREKQRPGPPVKLHLSLLSDPSLSELNIPCYWLNVNIINQQNFNYILIMSNILQFCRKYFCMDIMFSMFEICLDESIMFI